uniref:Uncharacterized protein n=1 Tax=Arundo donax TaxID=35708 RepID=A0A0A8ZCG4_ARUDO
MFCPLRSLVDEGLERNRRAGADLSNPGPPLFVSLKNFAA